MPQMAHCEYDYDENYGTFANHDSYGDDNGEGMSSKIGKTVSKPGFWQCSICTYDNDERLLYCDVCGVFRDSSSILEKNEEKKAYGTCKDSNVSIMARSLFARMSPRMQKTVIFSDGFLSREANNCEGKGYAKACFGALQKAFMVSNHKKSINIVPFRFDTLSPDDVVSSGKNPSRTDFKVLSAPSRALASTAGKKGIIKFFPEVKSDSSSASLSSDDHINECESSVARKNEEVSQVLASNLHHLKLGKKSATNRRGTSRSQFKAEKWMLSDGEEDISSQLNLAIVGHVDSGKSTLSGRLLHLLGRISKKVMHKYEKEANEKGKGSFAYAWAMDESSEERERGITMTVAVAYFETKRYCVVLLDSPGHKDFVPNLISGATQADAAILVVDASIGSFEAGMLGQTREHAQLIRSFGIEQLIVAVNKMDVVEYCKDRFDFIKSQLRFFLRSCGFKDSVTWIPLSAMENQNLLGTASDDRLSCWYQGLCLLDAIDFLQPPVRDVAKPLLLPICDVITSRSFGQLAACGKLELGAVRSGSKVLVMPSGDSATVRTIERDSHPCSVARAGDNVALSLQGVDGSHVTPGGVLCHPDFPVTVASSLELKILVLEITTPILIGSQVEFHIHHAKKAARLVKILSLIDQKTGNVSKRAPRFLTAKQSAIVQVTLDEAVCVEEFSSCRALGRAFLRASGNTIAVGVVTRVLEPEM